MTNYAQASSPVQIDVQLNAQILAETALRLAGALTSSSGVDVERLSDDVRRVKFWSQQLERAAVARLRADGATWEAVGDALGMSRQAAHARFRAVDA